MDSSEDPFKKDFLRETSDQLGVVLGRILSLGVYMLPAERADAIRRALEAGTLTFSLTLDFQLNPQRWTVLCNFVDGDGVTTSLDLGELTHGLSHPTLFLVKQKPN
jgi:hypothetical protein